jgi:hypothetical protein
MPLIGWANAGEFRRLQLGHCRIVAIQLEIRVIFAFNDCFFIGSNIEELLERQLGLIGEYSLDLFVLARFHVILVQPRIHFRQLKLSQNYLVG